MAVRPPESRVWWNEPVPRAELVWVTVAFLWGVVMFVMMIVWHLQGRQNLSTEVYRVDPDVFRSRVEAFVERYKVGEEGTTGIPVARVPPGGDAYMLGRLWEWWPVLELEKGKTYRLHLSSLDWQHGFSLQPVNMNIQIHPGIEHVITITPTEAGVFSVVCNEFCGVGHHQMIGRIRVVQPGKGG
ncbi:MAG: cytochrome C oxidase subunit II [Geminicoccaceae bacterium]|nr:cytochrome C oxidase subunit II [Geminicoccaceae bacterium]MCX7630200.1 cytochrome C oxidase subunit II [Geminicoccaceae bacterium]MDW8341451.1 cytochrome C oxidase subunit II [Geminicoccaceae bacterium]